MGKLEKGALRDIFAFGKMLMGREKERIKR